MLHILLFILKIVGILLLAVFCLFILAAAVFILDPVRYRLEGSAEEWADTIRGSCRFHWLFHLIRGEAVFEKGELKWRIRVAWKKFESHADPEEKAPASERETSSFHPEQEERGTENNVPEKEERVREIDSGSDPEKSSPRIVNKETVSEPEDRQDAGKEEKEEDTLYQKLCDKIGRIRDTFRRFCNKMKALMRRKERLSAFLSNETHKNAFRKVLSEFRRFLRYLHPKRLKAELEFGFEDPALTGYTLAWLSLIYPAVGESVEIRPDFHHRTLRGNLFAEGRIRIVYALIPAWNLVRDKNVRTTFRRIRKLMS